MAKRTCTRPGCERPHKAHGLCSAHYQAEWGKGAYQGRCRPTPIERFMEHVTITESGCWIWTGKPEDSGYGVIRVDGRNIKAHRFAYEHFIGPIPDGMEIDHRCHTEDKSCSGGVTCPHRLHVNPFLCLEVVTPQENKERGRLGLYNAVKTHCPRNHPYDEANTRIGPNGRRSCRQCDKERMRRVRALTSA